jgi:hypothetical protein
MYVECTDPDWPYVMKYQPAEDRNTGNPLKRLLNCDVETSRGKKGQVIESMMVVLVVTMIKLFCYVVSIGNEVRGLEF